VSESIDKQTSDSLVFFAEDIQSSIYIYPEQADTVQRQPMWPIDREMEEHRELELREIKKER
jgi:hypothetical protein